MKNEKCKIMSTKINKSVKKVMAGLFSFLLPPSSFLLTLYCLPVAAQQDSTGNAFIDQVIEVGANKDFTRIQSTAAVSVITNRDVNKRSAKNIGNSILGQGNGLVSLQGTGTYFEQNPTFYVSTVLSAISVLSVLRRLTMCLF